MTTANILDSIIATTRKHLQRKKDKIPIEFLKEQILRSNFTRPRGFYNALDKAISSKNMAIIAEIKKASPSKGAIARNFSPSHIAKIYEENGATCISVLTETDYFHGSDEHLKEVKQNSSLPVLRKDFIVDSYQIYESAFIGADCILLIAAILTDKQLTEFYGLAHDLQLDVLIEVHSSKEVARALKLHPALIGINNRDLTTFKVDLQTSVDLAEEIPSEIMIVCESGIGSRQDIQMILENNIHVFLVGETLLKAKDPGEQLRQLYG